MLLWCMLFEGLICLFGAVGGLGAGLGGLWWYYVCI